MKKPGKAGRGRQYLKSQLLYVKSSAAASVLFPRPRGQKLAEQRQQYKEAGEVGGRTTLTS